MSHQRRRGQTVKVWKRKLVTDGRDNKVLVADPASPYEERVAVIPQRSSRAEVPGQQQIDVVRLIIRPDLTDVGLWSEVEYRGDMWDIVAPPAYHNGVKRHTRHWSIDLRRRP